MRNTFILLFMLASFSLFSQNAAMDKLLAWEKVYKEADEIFYSADELADTEPGSRHLVKMCKQAKAKIDESIKYCEEAMALDPKYTYDAQLFIIESCLLAGWFSESLCCPDVFTPEVTLKYIEKALLLRPEKESIKMSSLLLNASKDRYNYQYNDLIYLAFISYFDNNSKTETAKFGKQYISMLKTAYGDSFAYSIFSNPDLEYQGSRVFRIVKFLPGFLTDADEVTEINVLTVEYFAAFFQSKQKKNTDYKLNESFKIDLELSNLLCATNLLLKSDLALVKRLANANQILNNTQYYIYFQGLYIVETPNVDNAEAFAFLENAMNYVTNGAISEEAKRTKDNMQKVCDKLYSNLGYNGEESDYIKLQKYYEFVGDFSKSNEIKSIMSKLKEDREKEERKQKFKSNWGLSVGFAPGKLIWYGKYHQISLHADLRTFGFSWGGRYCIYNQYVDNKRFGAWTEDPEVIGGSNTYSGYEASLWIPVFSFSKDFFSMTISPEGRYGCYNFNTVNANIVDRTTGNFQFVNYTVNPVGNRFDLSLLYRMKLWMAGRIYFEADASWGVGYRWLTSDLPDGDLMIADARFNDDRWPKVTAPLRLGFRIGLRLI